jgi:5-methylcytosine-specific restriction enzyme subunit McrC
VAAPVAIRVRIAERTVGQEQNGIYWYSCMLSRVNVMEWQSWLLTERVCSVVRLTPVDVVFLRANHPHIALVPTERRGRWRVTPGACVGVITAPTCRLVIQPKWPLANVWYLLDPDAEPLVSSDGINPVTRGDLLEVFGHLLVSMVRARVGAGLARGYAERSGQGGVLQGRPDVAAQLRENPLLKERLHWRGDDLTVDIPCNQVALATMEVLVSGELASAGLKGLLRGLLPAFEGVRPIVPPGWADRLDETLQPREYGPLLRLCRLLLEGLVPNPVGLIAGPSYLLDLERVWERYVLRCVRWAFRTVANVGVRAQTDHPIGEGNPDQPDLTMRPDVVVEQDGRPFLIVDAKWKRPRPGSLILPDVYQALAYAVGLHAARTILVYPGRRDQRHVYSLDRPGCKLEVVTLRAVGSAAACGRAMRRLGRKLRMRKDTGAREE